MAELTITHDLRILKRVTGDQSRLCQAREFLPAGTVIETIDIHEIFYDHRVQNAIRFDCGGDERFILESDVSAMIDSFAEAGTTRSEVKH